MKNILIFVLKYTFKIIHNKVYFIIRAQLPAYVVHHCLEQGELLSVFITNSDFFIL